MPRGRRGRNRQPIYNPSREYLIKVVEDFLNSGGKITKIPFNDENFNSFISTPDNKSEVDAFLLDQ